MLSREQWGKAYEAFRLLNITKADFYRNHLDEYCDGLEKPSIWSLYEAFKRIETQQPTADEPGILPSANTVRSIGNGIQIAGLYSLLEQPKVTRGITVRRASVETRQFSLTLSDGSHIEFETLVPEQLALQMLLLSRGTR